MGLNNFDIQFEKPLKIFFSGEELRGRVLIDLSSEKMFKQISLEIVGRGEVHWTEMRTVTRREGASREGQRGVSKSRDCPSHNYLAGI